MDYYNSSKNYKNYREFLKDSKPPTIPCLSILSKDLFALEEHHETFLKSENGEEKLINFTKMRLFEKITNEIMNYQKISYHFTLDEKIFNYLDSIPYLSEKELYQNSYQCQPKLVEKEKKTKEPK